MISINGKNYRELRCIECHKLICFESIAVGIIYYQCPRCDFINEFSFKYLKTKDNEAMIKDNSILKGGELNG